MGLKNLPSDVDTLLRIKRDYERRRFAYSPTNAEIARYTVDLLASWYPLPRAVVACGVRALLDEPMSAAFAMRRTSPAVGAALRGALRARGRIAGLLPQRELSAFRTTDPRSYPAYRGRRDAIDPSTLGTFAGARRPELANPPG